MTITFVYMVLNYWLSTLGLAFLNQIGTQYHFLAEWTCMGIDYQCFDHKDNPDGDFLCPEYSRYYGRDCHWYLLLVQGTSEANLYWIRYYVTNNWWCNIWVYFGKGQFKTQPRKYQSCLFEKKKWYVHQYMYYLLNFCYIYIIIQWKEIW